MLTHRIRQGLFDQVHGYFFIIEFFIFFIYMCLFLFPLNFVYNTTDFILFSFQAKLYINYKFGPLDLHKIQI